MNGILPGLLEYDDILLLLQVGQTAVGFGMERSYPLRPIPRPMAHCQHSMGCRLSYGE